MLPGRGWGGGATPGWPGHTPEHTRPRRLAGLPPKPPKLKPATHLGWRRQAEWGGKVCRIQQIAVWCDACCVRVRAAFMASSFWAAAGLGS